MHCMSFENRLLKQRGKVDADSTKPGELVVFIHFREITKWTLHKVLYSLLDRGGGNVCTFLV